MTGLTRDAVGTVGCGGGRWSVAGRPFIALNWSADDPFDVRECSARGYDVPSIQSGTDARDPVAHAQPRDAVVDRSCAREDSSQDMSHEMDDTTSEQPEEPTGSAMELAADDGVRDGHPLGMGGEELTFKYRAMRSLFRGSIKSAHRDRKSVV